MVDGGSDTIGQVRVDVAELKGILTTIVTDYGRRLVDLETAGRQLRVDLTIVKDNLDNRINTLVEKGNETAARVKTDVANNAAKIEDVRKDIDELHQKQFNLGTRVATYISPFISSLALIITAFEVFRSQH